MGQLVVTALLQAERTSAEALDICARGTDRKRKPFSWPPFRILVFEHVFRLSVAAPLGLEPAARGTPRHKRGEVVNNITS